MHQNALKNNKNHFKGYDPKGFAKGMQNSCASSVQCPPVINSASDTIPYNHSKVSKPRK